MAQLAEWLLQSPEVRGLNPVIGKNLYRKVNCIEKLKIKKKRPGMAHSKKCFFVSSSLPLGSIFASH